MAAANGTARGDINALSASEGVLSFFWDLASLDQAVRDKAATGLVAELAASQQQYEADSEAESDGVDDENAPGGKVGKGRAVELALRRCSPLMMYAVKRLVRGLGSGRQGARQGFALALTLVLGSPAGACISTQGAVTVVTSVLEAAGSAKGGEARDMLLGQVFGLGAVVRSGKSIDAPAAREIATTLVRIAGKKSFLQEAAAAVLLELAEHVEDSVLADMLGGVGGLKAWLTAPAVDATPEALLLAVRLWGRLPAGVVSSCPLLPSACSQPPSPTFFTSPTPSAAQAAGAAAAAMFSTAHLEELVPVLRATTHSHPRLHSVWPTLLALLIPGFTPDKEQRRGESGQAAAPQTACLGPLWSVVVEGDLFQSSHERKYLGFTLLGILLPHLKAEHVPLVFTPNFLRCLSNNLSKPDSYLHSTAKKCLERITSFAEKAEPSVRVAVSLALQRHGGAAFEKLTKAKKAGGMRESMDGNALAAQAAELQQTFLDSTAQAAVGGGESGGEEEEEEGGEEGEGGAAQRGGQPPQQQRWAVEQLCALCKQPSASADVRRAVLEFLALNAFFSLNPQAAAKSKDKTLKAAAQCSSQLSPAARQLCASRLIALADALSKPAGKGAQQGGQQGGDAQQQQQQQGQQARYNYVSEVVSYISKTQRLPGAELLAAQASEGAEEALGALHSLGEGLMQRLEGAAAGAGGEEAGRLRALQHLWGLLTLQVLGEPEAADAGVARDLEAIYRVACEGAEPPQGEAGGEALHWQDSLTDVILTLLAPHSSSVLPSAPLREAVEHVFRLFCEDLTATGMQDMLRIIGRPMESGKGEDEEGIFDSEEEEEGSEEEGGSEGGEEGSDAEEGEGEESQEESEEEDKAPAAAKAAGSSSEGSDEDDADDEGASDEAMFQQDAKLAAYFALAQEKRRGAKAAREELLNFKMRVAALLEAYIKKVPGSPLLPGAVLPLLSALAACSKPGPGGGQQAALADRLSGLIQNKLCRSKAEASGSGQGLMGEEELAAALKRCLYLASRPADKRVLASAAAAYTYLLRVCAGTAGGSLEKHAQGLESVTAAVSDLFTKKKSRLGRPFFQSLLRPPLSLGPLLLPQLLRHAVAARSDYMRGEAAALLAMTLKARSPEVDSAAVRSSAACGAFVQSTISRAAAAQEGGGKAGGHLVEALKAAAALLESLNRGAAGGAAAALGAKAAVAVEQGVVAALQAGHPPKLAGQLQRIQDSMRSSGAVSKAGGGEGKAAGKKKKEKAVAAQPAKGDGSSQGKRPAAAAGKEQGQGKKGKGQQQSTKRARTQ